MPVAILRARDGRECKNAERERERETALSHIRASGLKSRERCGGSSRRRRDARLRRLVADHGKYRVATRFMHGLFFYAETRRGARKTTSPMRAWSLSLSLSRHGGGGTRLLAFARGGTHLSARDLGGQQRVLLVDHAVVVQVQSRLRERRACASQLNETRKRRLALSLSLSSRREKRVGDRTVWDEVFFSFRRRKTSGPRRALRPAISVSSCLPPMTA